MNLSGEKKIIFKMIQNLRSHVTEGGVYLRNTLRIFENSFRRNNIHFESILGKKNSEAGSGRGETYERY